MSAKRGFQRRKALNVRDRPRGSKNRNSGGRFRAGHSGNPAGRPRDADSSNHHRHSAGGSRKADNLSPAIIDLLWSLAKRGSSSAMKTIVDTDLPLPHEARNEALEAVAAELLQTILELIPAEWKKDPELAEMLADLAEHEKRPGVRKIIKKILVQDKPTMNQIDTAQAALDALIEADNLYDMDEGPPVDPDDIYDAQCHLEVLQAKSVETIE